MPRFRRSRVFVAVLAVLALGSAAVVAEAAPVHSAKAKKKKVTIKGNDTSNYRFAPGTLTIKKGKTVHWSWNSNAPHDVTFFNSNKHSKTANQVNDYKRTFHKKGTFKYFCSVHGFTGKIVVTK